MLCVDAFKFNVLAIMNFLLILVKSFVLNNDCNRDEISTQRGFHHLLLNNA